MTALTGNKRKDTYKDLLQVSNSNSGIDATLRALEDGEGTSSVLYLSTTAVEVRGAFQLGAGGTFDLDGKELILDLDGDTSITADTDDQIDFKIGAADRGLWNATGLMIGSSVVAPDGTLHVHTASAGTVTATADTDDFIIEGGTSSVGMAILAPDTGSCQIALGGPTDADRHSLIGYQPTHATLADSLLLKVAGQNHMRAVAGGQFVFGGTSFDTAANANMTAGITIDQGAADNEILALKSSDVAHGVTLQTETDTFGKFAKYSSANGGMHVMGLADAGNVGLQLFGMSSGEDTTKTTAAVGVIDMRSAKANGTTIADPAANGNLLCVGTNSQSKFIVDVEGDLFADSGTSTTAVTVFDAFDDLALIRTFDLARDEVGQRGLIASQFDKFVEHNEQDLIDLGIIGGPFAEGGMINVTRLQKLHNGAIWQLYTQLRETQERLTAAEQRLLN